MLAAGSFLTPILSCVPRKRDDIRTNWAGNLEYGTNNYFTPGTLDELSERVRSCDKLRVVGTRHCFNDIADSSENQLSLENLDRVVELDEAAQTVTLEAGMSYGQLAPYLYERGYALHNLASLPHISVAGACATATHGSGIGNGNLATTVSGIEYVDAGGEVRTLTREDDGEAFRGAVVSLGSLGVITKLTLDVQPAYDMYQHVYLHLPLSQLEQHFEEIMSAGYSVSLFTDWQSETITQVWVKRKAGDGDPGDGPAAPESSFYRATPATEDVHPILGLSAENCTAQLGVRGPWYERLPHFRMNFTPSSGKELQSEYFVPREHALEAMEAIRSLRARLDPLLMVSEVRTIDADDLWMSTCYERASVAFHFTWEQDWAALKELLPALENKLEPFGARPHWGKMFTMPAGRIRDLYKKTADFRSLLAEHDPDGKFINDFVRRYIFTG